MNVEAAIKDYLTQANQDIKADQVVASGATITVDYIGRLNDKEVFDTSVKSVAEAAGGRQNPCRCSHSPHLSPRFGSLYCACFLFGRCAGTF